MFKKILIGSAIALVLGILVGFVGFPKLLNKMIKGVRVGKKIKKI